MLGFAALRASFYLGVHASRAHGARRCAEFGVSSGKRTILNFFADGGSWFACVYGGVRRAARELFSWGACIARPRRAALRRIRGQFRQTDNFELFR
jgi:hypothetical protein